MSWTRCLAPVLSKATLVAAMALSSSSLRPQDHVVGWGQLHFDTRFSEERCRSIAASDYHTAAVTVDGRLLLTGSNSFDCLDVAAPPPGRKFKHFGSNGLCHVALLDDGSVMVGGQYSPGALAALALPAGLRYDWVSNFSSVLRVSDGSFRIWNTPLSIPVFPAGTWPVRMNDAFGRFGAILSDGSLVMWGLNNYGQLSPPALPAGLRYVDFSIGYYHSVALVSDGTIVAFGLPGVLTSVPPLPQGTHYVLCAAGRDHSVAYRSDGVIVVWGSNTVGALNDIPIVPAGEQCVALAAGNAHSVALLSSGRALAWGFQALFAAGMPTRPGSWGPGGWVATARTTAIAMGARSAIVLYGDRSAKTNGMDNQLVLPQLPPGVWYARAEAEYLHSVLLRSDGLLEAIGDNSVGQCNIPPLPQGMTWTDFAVASDHTVMQRSDGQVFAVGDNAYGQTNIPALPVGVSYVEVDAAYRKTLLVRSDGEIEGVGYYAAGAPVLPPGIEYVDVTAGPSHNAALRSDGEVVEWGGFTSPWTPVPPLPQGVVYVEARAGDRVTALRRSDGQVVFSGRIGPLPMVAAMPPLAPRESCLQLSAAGGNLAARIGPLCSYVSFAQGCAGSLPASRLIPRDTPRIGKTLEVRVFDLPASVAMLAMGMHRMPATSLAGIGLPGCTWQVELDATAILVGQGGQAVWRLPIPDVPSLVGLQFHNQALVLDPQAPNPLGLVVSDAATGIVGYP